MDLAEEAHIESASLGKVLELRQVICREDILQSTFLLDEPCHFRIGISYISEEKKIINVNIYFCFVYYVKAFDYVDHNKLWKILKKMGIQTTWRASWETCMQVRKQQLELDMEKQTDSK